MNNKTFFELCKAGCEPYRPKAKLKKQLLLTIAFTPFLLTIGTNWLYFVGLKLLLKFDPLFLYR